MEAAPIQPQVKAAQMPLEKLATNPNVSDQDKVKEVSRQFEAVLLRQILAEARKTVVKSSANPNSAITEIYNDMVNNQMADSISLSGEFGLARTLAGQLAHQVLRPADAEKSAATPLGTKQLKAAGKP